MGRLGLLGCLGAIVLILLIGGGWYIGVRNHFVDLDQQVQAQFEGTENRIAVERRRYNEVAQEFNASVLKFPANLVANMSGFKPKAYFKGAAGSQNAPEVNFNFGTTAPATGTR